MNINKNFLNITEIFEIRLTKKTWLRIRSLAEYHQVSYSWIVRLCVLKVMESMSFTEPGWVASNDKIKKEYSISQGDRHRHMLCLYGKDSILLRLKAAQGRITISQFVRVALELQLSYLEKETAISKEKLVHTGIKSHSQLTEDSTRSLDMIFHIKSIKFTPFLRSSYRPFSYNKYRALRPSFSG